MYSICDSIVDSLLDVAEQMFDHVSIGYNRVRGEGG